jgi:hypothetical protein
MKLELDHLVPYLPYKLNGIWSQKKGIWYLANLSTAGSAQFIKTTKTTVTSICQQPIEEFKPLLLPISELYNHPADEEINNVCNGFIGVKYFHVNDCPYNSFQVLVKHHFDVFKLIDAGLALNKLEV